MKTAADNAPLAIPPDLLAEIQAAAAREHLPADNVLHHILERGLGEWHKEHPYTRNRVVFRTEDLSEAEVRAITEGEMDPRHNHLNAELE
jgi:hypothetical protein